MACLVGTQRKPCQHSSPSTGRHVTSIFAGVTATQDQQSSNKGVVCVVLQRQRPGSAAAGCGSSLGPGWYHICHTAVEKQSHAARLKPPAARPASAGQVKSAAGTPRSQLARSASQPPPPPLLPASPPPCLTFVACRLLDSLSQGKDLFGLGLHVTSVLACVSSLPSTLEALSVNKNAHTALSQTKGSAYPHMR